MIFIYWSGKMSSQAGLSQHYFMTPPRQIWGKLSPKSNRSSIKTITDSSTLCIEMETSPPPTPTTNGINHNMAPAEPSVAFNSEIFHSYLLALLLPVIGALPSELDSVFDSEFDERVAHFTTNTGGSLYVIKAKEDSEGMYPSILDVWHHS
jgi:hypothetical protein